MEELKMDPLKILVCDDIDPQAIRAAILSGTGAAGCEIEEPECWGQEDLEEALVPFFEDVKKLSMGEREGHKTLFDNYDVIFVDNNLGWLEIPGARQTAASIVGYLRAVTNCRYVVELNRNELTDFDLDHLIGDEESKADQSLNTEHLEIAGLWNFEKLDGEAEFLPWYWPELSKVSKDREKQWQLVDEKLEAPVLAALNFPSEAIAALSREATTFLNPTARGEEKGERKPIEETSFWDVARSCGHSMNFDDRTAIYTGIKQPKRDEVEDFVRRGKLPDDPLLKRFAVHTAAAEIEFWLRRYVLGPQRVLTDAPHLQAALRFRCGENADHLSEWNKTVTASDTKSAFDPELAQLIMPFQSDLAIWLHRPTFWWPSLEVDEALGNLRDEAKLETDSVFCEDTRRFRDRRSSSLHRFVPDLGAPVARFVEKLEGKTYEPGTRLAE
jgi:hypothetical protein